jgi:hypothetical protein
MANQFGLLVAFLLGCACLAYLSNAGWKFSTKRRRISLWDLFVLVTLVGCILGLIVGLPKEDTSGARPHFFHYIEQWQSEHSPDAKK